MTKHVMFSFAAMLPGLAISFVSLRYGLAWAFVGACVGFLCSFGRVDFPRIAKLFVAIVVAKNIPGMSHLMDPDPDALTGQEKEFSDRINDWFRGRDVGNRMNWIVGIAFLTSVTLVAIIAIHDYVCLQQNAPVWLISPTSKDGFGDLVLLYLVSVPCWGAGIAGILFSSAYRRPCLVFLIFPLIAFTAMAVAGSERSFNVLLGIGTLSLGIGTALGWLLGFD